MREHQIGDGTDHWLLDLVLDCMYIDHVSTFFSPRGFRSWEDCLLTRHAAAESRSWWILLPLCSAGGCQVQAKMCKIE